MKEDNLNHEEVWFWYNKIMECKLKGVSVSSYCRTHDLDLMKFRYMNTKIFWKKETNPELYKKIIPLTHEYQAGAMNLDEFSKNHNIAPNHISAAITHLKHLKIIEKYTDGKSDQPMKFVHIERTKKNMQTITNNEKAEIVEKQNDIEIHISKGIKVLISPLVDTLKIVKVIELLKDL